MKAVTISQVFVNGVLQPSTLYQIDKGTITLISKDVPEKSVPIIVQSIRTPVVLEVADFSNTSSAITVPQIISAPAINVTT